MSGLAADGYYSFAERGGYDGLVRVRAGGRVFEYLGGPDGSAAWVRDQSIAKNFADSGWTTLAPIDRATAERLAERYGAKL